MKSAYVGVLSIIELKNARWNIENLLIVLCPIQRPITSQDCVLLRDNSLVFTVRLRPEISFRACLRVLTRPSFLSSLRPCSPHRAPQSRSSIYRALIYCLSNFLVKEHSNRFPNGVPMKRDARFQNLLLHIARSPLPKKKVSWWNKISPFSKTPV